jgi:hypothetical protein
MARALGPLISVMAVLAGAAGAAAQDPAPGIVTTLPRPAELLPPPPPPDAPPAPLPNVLPPPAPDALAGPPCLPTICPCGPTPGLTAAVEFGILVPHLKNALVGPVTLQPGGIPDVVAPPTAELDGTLAPKITLGWRLRDGLGAILVSYRNLESEGTAGLPGFDAFGDGLLRSRLDLNFVDVAYSTREMPLGALWALRWEVGSRLLAGYFDSQAQGLILGQRSSNYFIGAGPQLALDLTREIPSTGLALFARADAAEILGHVRQRFAESVGDPNQPLLFGGTTQSGSQAAPQLILQAGLSWLSHPDGRYRITCGYQWEQLWGLGNIAASRGDVRAQGFFVRSEFNF